MNNKEIIFRITGKTAEGAEVSPDVFDIKQAKTLINEIDKFIEAGLDSKREPIGILIEDGSWKAVLLVPLFLAIPIQADIEAIEVGEFDRVHPIRREVVSTWQKKYKNTNLNIEIGTKEKPSILKINKDTNFEVQDIRVETEDLLYGFLENLGGATPNFHLRITEGSTTRSATISASKEVIMKLQKEVPLYDQEIGVEVLVQENIKTGEMRDFKYQSHHFYSPKIDPIAFQQTIASGTKAWANVPNATEWVKAHRS